MIYILTGHIRTGKTSDLLEWSKNRTDIDGLLCPDDDFGKHYFLKIKNQGTFPLEVSDDSKDVLAIKNGIVLKNSWWDFNFYFVLFQC